MIPRGRHVIDENDIEAVAPLRSGWLTQGPTVDGFEEAVAACIGAMYAVAVANGTARCTCVPRFCKRGQRARCHFGHQHVGRVSRRR